MINNNLVEVKNNTVVVSSLQIAEHFGKRHDNILQSLTLKLRGANGDRLFEYLK